MRIHHRDLETKGRTACGKRYGKGRLIESARITAALPTVAIRATTCLDCLRSLARDARLHSGSRAAARFRLRRHGDTSLEFAARTIFGTPRKPLPAWGRPKS
jgi:hypothetical protein